MPFVRRKKTYLVLEDGSWYGGYALGPQVHRPRTGEVVFNTAMSGYQETITDPSYKGQLVCFTYPSIGNYGINKDDFESEKAWLDGVILKDYNETPSNFRSEKTLEEFLFEQNIPGITGTDTRALVRRIREGGSILAAIVQPEEAFPEQDLAFNAWIAQITEEIKKTPPMTGKNLTKDFSPEKANIFISEYVLQKNMQTSTLKKIAVLDFGIKFSILSCFIDEGFYPVVFKGESPLAENKDFHEGDYQGFFFSNGPGDPAVVSTGIENIRYLITTGKPSLGICLGHQMIGLALGAKTYKLKFGHHGGNQPVKAEYRKQIIITSQNHGFAIDEKSLREKIPQIKNNFELNANDLTTEGFFINSESLNVISVQYHPEASPGPRDARIIFREFANLIDEYNK